MFPERALDLASAWTPFPNASHRRRIIVICLGEMREGNAESLQALQSSVSHCSFKQENIFLLSLHVTASALMLV